ncbi:MAG: zinc-binding alcohol dehydrogenase family protein [Vicinamibacterales bacterium]
MRAAVVEHFGHPPRYREFEEPALFPGEVRVTVRAAALSQLVRMQAAGTHYTRTTPPFVPGTDGVGLLADGTRVYFAFPRQPLGTMAEFVAVPAANIVPLPDDLDDVTAAAIANPGMSSWAALTERAGFVAGETVLINGASGASGRLAIQIAKYLGAGRVIATARNADAEAALRALGADGFVPLDQPVDALTARFRRELADGVDVVLDYLWGAPAEALLRAMPGHGHGEAARRIRVINIGSSAGMTLSLHAAALRSSGLELMGSGLGSLSNEALIQAKAQVLAAARPAGLRIDTSARPLSEVAGRWTEATGARVVFTIK